MNLCPTIPQRPKQKVNNFLLSSRPAASQNPHHPNKTPIVSPSGPWITSHHVEHPAVLAHALAAPSGAFIASLLVREHRRALDDNNNDNSSRRRYKRTVQYCQQQHVDLYPRPPTSTAAPGGSLCSPHQIRPRRLASRLCRSRRNRKGLPHRSRLFIHRCFSLWLRSRVMCPSQGSSCRLYRPGTTTPFHQHRRRSGYHWYRSCSCDCPSFKHRRPLLHSRHPPRRSRGAPPCRQP